MTSKTLSDKCRPLATNLSCICSKLVYFTMPLTGLLSITAYESELHMKVINTVCGKQHKNSEFM